MLIMCIAEEVSHDPIGRLKLDEYEKYALLDNGEENALLKYCTLEVFQEAISWLNKESKHNFVISIILLVSQEATLEVNL